MADYTISTSSASAKKGTKRKSSEMNSVGSLESICLLYTNNDSVSNARDLTRNSNLADESGPPSVSVSRKIKQCTSDWTLETLNKLKIISNTTEVYKPMELIDLAFSDLHLKMIDPKIEERVCKCKDQITRLRTLGNLDIDEIEGLDHKILMNMMFESNDDLQYMKINEWNIAPRQKTQFPDEMEDRFYKKFQVHGEEFARQLIYMSLCSQNTEQSVSEHMYLSLFQQFAGLLGLSSYTVPVLYGQKLKIGETVVTSVPDIIFPDLGKSQNALKVIAVCKVTCTSFSQADYKSPVKTKGMKKESETVVNHLNDNLIGQLGGELLLHLPSSQNQSGLLGIIIQKTNITFSHFYCTKRQFEEIQTGSPHFSSYPVIHYSRPYNYLRADDRQEILEPLLKLGFIQCTPFI